MTKVALISDTHNFLSPQALEELAKCEHIICAGDFHSLKFLRQMEGLAPVTACRGNCDYGPWAQELPGVNLVEIEDVTILVIHNLDTLDIDPLSAGVDLVVYGHTHCAKQHYDSDVLYVNPGSASEPRYGQKAGMAVASIDGSTISIEFVCLD